MSLSAQPTRPTSRGTVRIRSADPFAHPAIRPNYLATEEDRAAMLRGARLLRAMAEAEPLAGLIEAEVLPGPAVETDSEWMADIRARAGTVYHPVGTCRMGEVVDQECRVRGVEGLRVVDASVFPNVTSGNTNAPTTMVAEKVAGGMGG